MNVLSLWPLFALVGGLAALNFPLMFQDFSLTFGAPWAAYALALLLAVLVLREAGHSKNFILLFTALLTFCPAVIIGLSNGRLESVWGLILLAAAVNLNQPRLPGFLLAVWSVCLGVLAEAEPSVLFVLFIAAGSLLATWPLRARNLFLGSFISFVVAAYLSGSPHSLLGATVHVWWLKLPLLDAILSGVFLGVVAVQMVYHWRWWPAPVQLGIGVGAVLLVVALSAGPMVMLPIVPLALYTLLQRLDYQGRGAVLRRR